MNNTIALISAQGGLFISNKTLFEKARANFLAITMEDSTLSKQSFISEKILCSDHTGQTFIDWLITRTDIIEKLPQHVLWDDDDSMYLIARSDLSSMLKRKLLPMKSAEFFHVAGSKVGQIKMFRSLGIPHPKTDIDIDFGSNETCIPFPCIAKADRFGGGGRYSQIVENMAELKEFRREHSEVLVQEIVEGTEFSVECFYRGGQLVFAQFGQMLDLLNGNGPSSRRHFYREIPHEVVRELRTIGEALDLNGLINCTLFLESSSGRYLFFEFDVRLNSWAHVSSDFGLDVANYFASDPICNDLKMGKPINSVEYIDPSRWMAFAKSEATYPILFPVIFLVKLIRMRYSGSRLTASNPLLAKRFLHELLLLLKIALPDNLIKFLKRVGFNGLVLKVLS